MKYLIYETETGNILGHGDDYLKTKTEITCGDFKLKGYKEDKISSGAVEVWVEDATNISELGTIIEVDRAEQDAKPAEEKTLELQFKTLWTDSDVGGTVPVQEGDLDVVMLHLNTEITTALGNNELVTAITLQQKATNLSVLWQKLGDEIYSKYLGE